MFKLYRLSPEGQEFWQGWDCGPGSYEFRWGTLGEVGETKTVKSTFLNSARRQAKAEAGRRIANGFREIPDDEQSWLVVEYEVVGMGSKEDLAKRHRLEDFLNERLCQTGLGECDGGSIGSGTMEVVNLVVDLELAKKKIIQWLSGTEFSNYSRIFEEGAE